VYLNTGPTTAEDAQTAVWWGHTDRDLFLGVWTEKRNGLGEDAEPTLLHHVPTGRGLIGVYDGLGGSGARQAGRTVDGRSVSHAFVASRLAHLAVRQWFVAGRAHQPSLRDSLRQVFDGAPRPGGLKLRGTLTRELPTTIALLEYAVSGPSLVDVTVRWAGDSRCYVLSPEAGLRQLSRDDSAVDDALEVLVADQPMTNLVSAGGRFEIHERTLAVDYPCLLVCATDGFFNYVDTPALFEYHLLDRLAAANNPQEWAALLAAWVQSIAADDATLALVSIGMSRFRDLRRCYESRLRTLGSDHWEPMQRPHDARLDEEQRRSELLDARRQSWLSYRSAYSALMPEPAAPADGSRS
jgi:serine/threonine protein phosphatase PrpC